MKNKTIKERLVGTIVTLAVSCITFLLYSYVGSFETKAASESKYATLDKKVSIILCLMDKTYCVKQMEKDNE